MQIHKYIHMILCILAIGLHARKLHHLLQHVSFCHRMVTALYSFSACDLLSVAYTMSGVHGSILMTKEYIQS